MWAAEGQTHHHLIWINERQRYTLKDILCQDMGISMRLLYKLKSSDNIFVDGKRQMLHFRPPLSARIQLRIPDEISGHEKIHMDLAILYEDEDILAVTKEPFRVVHPTRHYKEQTLLHGIEFYFEQKAIASKVRLINRLDRDTSGILLVAKNAFAHHLMTTKDVLKETSKNYVAIVSGKVEPDAGVLQDPIALGEDGIRRCVSPEGKEAVTHYRVLEQQQEAALVAITLETGRTHQIRVHFSHRGNPLLGDSLYGTAHPWIQRQALHCTSMIFKSPRKQEDIKVHAPMPEDMAELWARLKGAQENR